MPHAPSVQLIPLLLASLLLSTIPTPARAVSLESVTAAYGLTSASYNFSVPATALDSTDADAWLTQNWDLNGKISFGAADLVFSPDPSTSSSTLVRRASKSTSSSSSSSSSSSAATSTMGATSPASTALGGLPPVLRVEYPSGSYSGGTGGSQFYAQPLDTGASTSSKSKKLAAAASSGNGTSDEQYERMLLSYDIWFPSGFAWNMGGKLPGLRGGPDRLGCSGGNETNGTSCFSTRLMWRANGAGEVYAYVPTTQPNFCSSSNIICNSDYGTSMARGSFSFTTGQWQTIWLMVALNQVGTANGVVQLWYNGVQALSFTNLELRSASSLASIGGLYFSTFFGGDTSDWATPSTQHNYYRNIQLYAGVGAANGTGASIASSAAIPRVGGSGWWLSRAAALVLGAWGLSMVL